MSKDRSERFGYLNTSHSSRCRISSFYPRPPTIVVNNKEYSDSIAEPETHVLDINYGLNQEDILRTICEKADEYRRDLGITTITGYLRQAIKNDIYDTIFLKVKEDPWSTVLMHKKERYAETHLLRSRTAEYMVNGVYEATGLSLKEFLEQPTYMVEFIISTLRQLSSSTRTEAKVVENELKKQGAGFDNIKKR